MSNSKWIWHFGDFEIYHTSLQNMRREQFGVQSYLPLWRTGQPHSMVKLYKKATIDTSEEIKCHANCLGNVEVRHNGKATKYNLDTKITLEPGENMVIVSLQKMGGIPSVIVFGNEFASNETWLCASYSQTEDDLPCGCNEHYTRIDDDVEKFFFVYDRIYPISRKTYENGTLFDFGKETYGLIHIDNISPNVQKKILIKYGESEEEALADKSIVYIFDYIDLSQNSITFKKRAFRYIFIEDDKGISYDISCDYEHLDIKNKAMFRCEDEKINKVYDACEYTLLLNMREGFLDGIKRDGWLWSGDAYQSYYVNYYSFFDVDTVKRTIIGLRGNDPIGQNINTIPDYSMYWICSIYDYYFHTGDYDFIKSIWPRIVTMLKFLESHCDNNGFYIKHSSDWVFIDWADTAKLGIVSALQMLFAHTYEQIAKIAEVLDIDNNIYLSKAENLKQKINDIYWDEKQGAFIDSIKNNTRDHIVTRHANIFAILFNLTSEDRQKSIYKNVIYNPNIAPITTPYFEFFELDALGKMGDLSYMTDMLNSYWGKMIELGATTIWEQFDPTKKGIEHYEMYGSQFGCSLCHAWGANPIYLIGRYILGVAPTSAGYKTFIIKPNKACFKDVCGRVPLPNGYVDIKIKDNEVKIISTCEGGTVEINDKKYVLKANKQMTFEI
ncbi:MAG: hypothetical protein MJ236_05540 [Clostridia bacterium]|nr:hypothetical protein [Clostridia bacterium]